MKNILSGMLGGIIAGGIVAAGAVFGATSYICDKQVDVPTKEQHLEVINKTMNSYVNNMNFDDVKTGRLLLLQANERLECDVLAKHSICRTEVTEKDLTLKLTSFGINGEVFLTYNIEKSVENMMKEILTVVMEKFIMKEEMDVKLQGYFKELFNNLSQTGVISNNEEFITVIEGINDDIEILQTNFNELNDTLNKLISSHNNLVNAYNKK